MNILQTNMPNRWCKAGIYAAALYMSAGVAFGAHAASGEDASELDALEPIFHSEMPVPQTRPDIALAYPSVPVDISVPLPRPRIEDILPKSTRTLAEMVAVETGLTIQSEDVFTLKSGEGLGQLLRRAGYSQNDIAAAITSIQGKARLRALPIGKAFTISEHGFVFNTKAGRDVYALRHPDSGWIGLSAVRPVERYLAFAHGTISDSIYRAAEKADVPDAALNEYVRVMGFSVDFQREIRSGDAFELLYERKVDMLTGEEVGTTLHYVGLLLSGNQLGFYRFQDGETKVGWYDKDGNSAARTLIRTPISGARLSSSYGMRRHPVSGYNAMHRGVDFAAKTGTPIIAAGSGVVKLAGWKGSYGRYIRIRHNATYDTAYAHLSRIAGGISAGARVQQGQVIGYVGSTGRSTGPHLHYEILVNNRKVNPMTVSLPTGEKIDPDQLDLFLEQVQLVEAEVMANGALRYVSNNHLLGTNNQ